VLCPAGQRGAQGCGTGGKSSPPCLWGAMGLGDGWEAASGSAAEPGLTPCSHTETQPVPAQGVRQGQRALVPPQCPFSSFPFCTFQTLSLSPFIVPPVSAALGHPRPALSQPHYCHTIRGPPQCQSAQICSLLPPGTSLCLQRGTPGPQQPQSPPRPPTRARSRTALHTHTLSS